MQYRYHTHSNTKLARQSASDFKKSIRRAEIFRKILIVMASTSFLFGLLMVIGTVGSVQVSIEEYIAFKLQILGGICLMVVGAFFGNILKR